MADGERYLKFMKLNKSSFSSKFKASINERDTQVITFIYLSRPLSIINVSYSLSFSTEANYLTALLYFLYLT